MLKTKFFKKLFFQSEKDYPLSIINSFHKANPLHFQNTYYYLPKLSLYYQFN